MIVDNVPIKEIALVNAFNHRKRITQADCSSLANSILTDKLQSPIITRTLDASRPKPADPQCPTDADLISKGYGYKVISGHRRLTAYTLLSNRYEGYENIPAVVHDQAEVSEVAEYNLNAIENLQRKEITGYEEALIVQRYTFRGYGPEVIADILDKPPSWTKLRIDLMRLPMQVGELLHDGKITWTDVRKLRQMKGSREELLRQLAKIRDTRNAGGSVSALWATKSSKKAKQKKTRTRTEVLEMQTMIRTFCRQNRDDMGMLDPEQMFTEQGNSLLTVLLGWTGGFLSNEDLYTKLESFFDILGTDFEYKLE